uniref:Uncharacterized protein n=1 Tax=Paramormyrops kingsleyae TaxID=1676925 RepID=A0A3B3Q8E4_9TELE
MSACGDFAEHVWKPGSCKNCFHPRNAHGSGDNTANVRTSTASAEDDGLTFSSYYCKPTIAVRPTMMNPENSDIWMDVNMNTEPVSLSPLNFVGIYWLGGGDRQVMAGGCWCCF